MRLPGALWRGSAYNKEIVNVSEMNELEYELLNMSLEDMEKIANGEDEE